MGGYSGKRIDAIITQPPITMITRTPQYILAALFLLLTASWVLTGCDQSSMEEPEGTTYRASLTALNSSGVSGEATIVLKNDRMAIDVASQGTVVEQVHAQHIHGSTDGSVSSCPTMSDDANDDGRVSVNEGAPAYGGILVPLDGSLNEAEGLGDLETFPTGNGSYNYRSSIATESLAVNGDRSFAALRLEDHAIVVHGRNVDGEYSATLPVACGTLTRTQGDG